jgi:hypothetical protein
MTNTYINNKNKKISELRAKDTITTYSNHSWLPIAQYNQRTNSYHNVAINLSSITTYCNSYSVNYTNDEISKLHGQYEDLERLSELNSYLGPDSISYYISNSSIANNIVSYTFSYSKNYFDWQFL